MDTDVAIVGGGLTGAATLYYLAEAGVDAVLLERGDLNTRASGCNAGSIHAQIPHENFVVDGEDWARGFAPVLPLMIRSIGLWAGLGEALGADLEFTQTGGILVAESEAQMAVVRRKAELEGAHGVPIELLDRDALREIAPYVSDRMVGGAFCPIEGKANPLLAAFAFVRAAERLGGRVLARTSVDAIARVADGFAIATGRGPMRARRVVDAAGVEAGRIAAMVGIALAVEAHPLQVAVTEPAPPTVGHLVYYAGDKLTLKQTAARSLVIGGGWPARPGPAGARPAPRIDSMLLNLGIAARVVPALANLRIVRTWPALANGTADWRPVLGEAPEVPGFFAAIFPWMGFTAGPVTARITADLLLGRDPGLDLAPFSIARHRATQADAV